MTPRYGAIFMLLNLLELVQNAKTNDDFTEAMRLIEIHESFINAEQLLLDSIKLLLDEKIINNTSNDNEKRSIELFPF